MHKHLAGNAQHLILFAELHTDSPAAMLAEIMPQLVKMGVTVIGLELSSEMNLMATAKFCMREKYRIQSLMKQFRENIKGNDQSELETVLAKLTTDMQLMENYIALLKAIDTHGLQYQGIDSPAADRDPAKAITAAESKAREQHMLENINRLQAKPGSQIFITGSIHTAALKKSLQSAHTIHTILKLEAFDDYEIQAQFDHYLQLSGQPLKSAAVKLLQVLEVLELKPQKQKIAAQELKENKPNRH